MALRRVNDAGETVQRWFDRRDAFRQQHKEGVDGMGGEDERVELRRAVEGIWPPLMPGVGEDASASKAPVDQVALNLCNRWVRRVQSMAFDESPEIRYPRDRRGAEKVAEGVDRFMARVTEKGGLPMRFRDGVPLVGTDGCFAIYYGSPYLTSASQIAAQAKDGGVVLEEAQAGVHEAHQGQDHRAIGSALLKQATDPLEVVTNDPAVTEAVGEAAAAHAEMAAEEAKVGHHRPAQKGRLFYDLLVGGRDVTWDADCCGDPLESRWMMRRVVLSEDESAVLEALHPEARPMLQAREPEGTSTSTTSSETVSVSQREDSRVVEVWEVWDRRYGRRHYISQGCEYYLEADDTYPYLNDDGDPALPWFYPIEIVVVEKGVQQIPQSTHGVPALRCGYPIQLELIKVESYALQAIKRASVDKHLVDPRIAGTLMSWLSDGKPGVAKGVDGLDDQRKAIVPLEFKAPLVELLRERDNLIARFSVAMNFPLSQLTSQPVADTATQEEMALSSGDQGVADIVAVLQYHYGRVVHGSFLLACVSYSPEALGEVAGAQFVESVTGLPLAELPPEMVAKGLAAYAALLKNGPLKDEMPVVRFGATSKDNDPRRVEQLMKFLPIAMGAGLDAMPVVQEIGRSLGIGDLQAMQQPLLPDGSPQPPQGDGGDAPGGAPGQPTPPAGGPGQAQTRQRGKPPRPG